MSEYIDYNKYEFKQYIHDYLEAFFDDKLKEYKEELLKKLIEDVKNDHNSKAEDKIKKFIRNKKKEDFYKNIIKYYLNNIPNLAYYYFNSRDNFSRTNLQNFLNSVERCGYEYVGMFNRYEKKEEGTDRNYHIYPIEDPLDDLIKKAFEYELEKIYSKSDKLLKLFKNYDENKKLSPEQFKKKLIVHINKTSKEYFTNSYNIITSSIGNYLLNSKVKLTPESVSKMVYRGKKPRKKEAKIKRFEDLFGKKQ